MDKWWPVFKHWSECLFISGSFRLCRLLSLSPILSPSVTNQHVSTRQQTLETVPIGLDSSLFCVDNRHFFCLTCCKSFFFFILFFSQFLYFFLFFLLSPECLLSYLQDHYSGKQFFSRICLSARIRDCDSVFSPAFLLFLSAFPFWTMKTRAKVKKEEKIYKKKWGEKKEKKKEK